MNSLELLTTHKSILLQQPMSARREAVLFIAFKLGLDFDAVDRTYDMPAGVLSPHAKSVVRMIPEQLAAVDKRDRQRVLEECASHLLCVENKRSNVINRANFSGVDLRSFSPFTPSLMMKEHAGEFHDKEEAGFSPLGIKNPPAKFSAFEFGSQTALLYTGFGMFVAETAARMRYTKLFFLMRAGKFLKEVYDEVVKADPFGMTLPPSALLHVSRRSTVHRTPELSKHLSGRGFRMERNCIVDSGWQGTIHKQMKRMGFPCHAIFVGGKDQSDVNCFWPQTPTTFSFFPLVTGLEMLLNAPGGTTIGYAEDGLPKLETNEMEEKVWQSFTKDYQAGVLSQVASQTRVLRERAVGSDELRGIGVDMTQAICETPPRCVAEAFFSLWHDFSGTGTFYPVAEVADIWPGATKILSNTKT